jgi:NADH-quinone oxidoreductase subunit C
VRETTLSLEKVVAKLGALVPGALLAQESFDEDDRISVARAQIRKVCAALKSDPELDFNLLVDLTCVDYIEEAERFEVIYQLFSLSHNYRLRVKARVPEGETIDTVSTVWRVANPLEREAWDMYGVVFKEHPRLTRMLMYDGFEGHPLRKDYPLKKHQPIVDLRFPIETHDDPPYNWNTYEKKFRQKQDE